MSFTTDVKKELIEHYTKAEHCRIAELSAILLLSKNKTADKKTGQFSLEFDDEELAKKCFTTISKTLNIGSVSLENDIHKKRFKIIIGNQTALLLEQTGLDKGFPEAILKKTCCKRAFLRGAFISGGNISNPEKNYHFEIICGDKETCEFISEIIVEFNITAKISGRRDKYIVYIKESVEIVDMLNVIEAHKALMDFENMRIIREMRGNINRKVNCETANIGKTIDAAYKQIEDINYIKDTVGLSVLDENLKEIAKTRIENPDLPLSQLGQTLMNPIGKSGVNHRLRKISRIADDLRKSERK